MRAVQLESSGQSGELERIYSGNDLWNTCVLRAWLFSWFTGLQESSLATTSHLANTSRSRALPQTPEETGEPTDSIRSHNLHLASSEQ